MIESYLAYALIPLFFIILAVLIYFVIIKTKTPTDNPIPKQQKDQT